MANDDKSPTARALSEVLYAEGKLIPFIGAGLSTRFNVPSWSQLVDIIAEELGWDPEVFRLNGNFLQLAEYFVAEKGNIGPLRSRMDKLFYPKDADILASRAHMALVEMRPPLIYTTNFDDIIERAFKLKGVPYHVIAGIRDIAGARPGSTHIVKFHGTFADDKSLVLTESSYFERLEFESALDIRLRSDILAKTLLFVGYSFSDINIRYMLYKLNKLRAKDSLPDRLPTAVMTAFSPGQVERKLLEKWDVVIVELDPLKKDESLDRFLEGLR
jgi:hypothetical protein